MKKQTTMAVFVLLGTVGSILAANPITNQGAVLTWETEKTDNIAGGTNINISAAGTLDWILFSSNSWPQAEQSKASGSALDNFSSPVDSSRVKASGARALMFNWTDGSPTNSSAGTDMDATISAFVNGYDDPNNEVLYFDLTLPGGPDTYVMRTYQEDQRLASRLEVSNTVSGVWENFPEEAGNDAGDLRLHIITITDVSGPTTFSFRLKGRKTGATHGLRCFGGIAVETISPTGEPELLLTPSDQLNIALMAPASLATGTVDVAFLYGSSSNNVDVTSVTFSNLSHGAGSFTGLDAFPINLTDPSPSNETLRIQFDNGTAGLSNGESAGGIALVSWTELGSGATNVSELAVAATYDDAPAELLLNPSGSLYLTVLDPQTVTTGSVAVSYNAATAFPTGVVITAVDFSNTTHAVFSNLTPLNLELNDPSPSNALLDIEFDANGLSNGDVATGLVVVAWNEMGDATEYQSILPIYGAYHVLSPVTGTVSKRDVFPTNNVVIASRSGQNGAAFVRRTGLGGSGAYSKVTQEIKASALSGGNHTFDSLYLRMRFGNDLRTASGANQLTFWFGTIDETTGETNATVSVESFDCSIVDFNKNKYYEFMFGSPVSFDPAALASNESYAIQMWFTSDDPRNELIFWHSESTNTVDGGYYVEVDPTSSDTTFPIGMSTNRLENKDLHFALVNSEGTEVEIGDVTVVIDGSSLIMGWEGVVGASYAVQRTEDLVSEPWSNVVEGISGEGTLSVTNDTTDPQAFYRTILE
jgi:hypothetical protein